MKSGSRSASLEDEARVDLRDCHQLCDPIVGLPFWLYDMVDRVERTMMTIDVDVFNSLSDPVPRILVERIRERSYRCTKVVVNPEPNKVDVKGR